MKEVFSDKRKKENQTNDQLIAELSQQIGQQKIEFSWVKKRLSRLSHRDRKQLIERGNGALSLTRQVNLLNISRSNRYDQPVMDQKDLAVMNALDEIYTDFPFSGSR